VTNRTTNYGKICINYEKGKIKETRTIVTLKNPDFNENVGGRRKFNG